MAVSSALGQDDVDVEVLVVDDASTDDSAEVALGLAAADPRVTVLVHEENAGHIRTYNDGLAKVSGDYVVLLSADDALPRNALTRAVALMEHHPEVGLVYGFPRNFSDQPESEPDRVRSWSTWRGQDWFARTCRTGRNVIMSPEVVVRRLAWDEIGAYDTDLPHAADMAVWLQVALHWDIGRVNGPAQAHYRVHDANMHLTQYAGMETDLRQRRTVFERALADPGPIRSPRSATALRDQADRALARTAVRLARLEGIGADPDADVAAFEAFAQETWPAIVETRMWREYQQESRAGARPGSRFARRVRTHLQWRRWRRYGL
jgi:hypothetical protein